MTPAPPLADFADAFQIGTENGTLYSRKRLRGYLIANVRRTYGEVFSLAERRIFADRFMACPNLHGCRGKTPAGVGATLQCWVFSTDDSAVVAILARFPADAKKGDRGRVSS